MIDTNSLETNNHQLSYQSNTAQIGATSAYGLSNSSGGGSFIGNLPVGYQAFSGTLIRTDDFTTAVEGGIYGAPPQKLLLAMQSPSAILILVMLGLIRQNRGLGMITVLKRAVFRFLPLFN